MLREHELNIVEFTQGESPWLACATMEGTKITRNIVMGNSTELTVGEYLCSMMDAMDMVTHFWRCPSGNRHTLIVATFGNSNVSTCARHV